MAFWNDRDDEDITGGLNIQLFTEWMEDQDPLLVSQVQGSENRLAAAVSLSSLVFLPALDLWRV